MVTETSPRTFIGFRTSEEIAEQLRQLAAEEDRSVSNLVNRVVAEHLEHAEFVRSKS